MGSASKEAQDGWKGFFEHTESASLGLPSKPRLLWLLAVGHCWSHYQVTGVWRSCAHYQWYDYHCFRNAALCYTNSVNETQQLILFFNFCRLDKMTFKSTVANWYFCDLYKFLHKHKEEKTFQVRKQECIRIKVAQQQQNVFFLPF